MKQVREALAAAVVFGLAVLTHHEVLGYWFVSDDTIPLIETNRVTAARDLLSIFTEPLLHGTQFAAIFAQFYRPIVGLSFALEYWVWGLDPFGYHLTDLLLHATLAALVYAFVREATGDDLAGVVAGCLFAVHPITAELVPAPARRQDALAGVFLLSSLVLFLKRLDVPRGRARRYLAGSVVAYLLALGSKEVAAILLGLIGTWFVLTSYASNAGAGLDETIRRGTAVLGPYIVVTVGYGVVRTAVLGGVGGYENTPPFSVGDLDAIAAEYVVSLVYPVDVIGAVSSYGVQLIPIALYVAVGVALVGLSYVTIRVGGPRPVLASRYGRLVVLSGAWLAAHVPLFVPVPGQYTARHGYLPLVPFVTIVAVALAVAMRNLRASSRSVSVEASLTAVVVGTLIVSLVAVSPLVHPYDEWKCASEVSADVLPTAVDETRDLPPNAVVGVHNLPHGIERPPSTTAPRVKTASYFRSYTIASWIRLTRPNSSINVYPAGGPRAIDGAVDVDVTVSRVEGKQFPRMFLEYSPRSPHCHDAGLDRR